MLDLFFGLYRKRIAVIRSFGVTDRTTLIDIACGTGHYSILTCARYLGIDKSSGYITRATARYGSSTKQFLCADVNTVNIKDASYDVAILVDTVHHLSDEENQELFATLNCTASHAVILCEPVKQSPRNIIGRFLTSLDRGTFIRPKKELLSLVNKHFIVERIIDLKMMGIENICILARPTRRT